MEYKIFFLFVLFLIPSVHAVGIGGAASFRIKEVYIPDSEYAFAYLGIGDQRTTKSYDVFSEGPFTDYITWNTKTNYIDLPANSTFPFSGIIHMPSSMEPGWKYQKICVRENCVNGQICARGSACAVLEILVPYAGIKPFVKMTVKDINPGDLVIAGVEINNEGDTRIENCSGTLEIRNADSSITKHGVFSSTSVEATKKAGITAEIESEGLLPGDYDAFATIDCDGLMFYPNATFTVGELNVKILNYTKELNKDSIDRFIVTVESGWNDPMDIYATIGLRQGDTSVSAKTTTEELRPWAKQDLMAYVDTKDLEPGVVDLSISAIYLGHNTKLEDKINIVGDASTEPVDEEKEVYTEKASNTSILTILLIIAVILLTSVNIYLAMRKKRQE